MDVTKRACRLPLIPASLFEVAMRRRQSTPMTPTLQIRFYSTRNDRPEVAPAISRAIKGRNASWVCRAAAGVFLWRRPGSSADKRSRRL